MKRVLQLVVPAAMLACAARQPGPTARPVGHAPAARPGPLLEPGALSPEQIRLVQRSLVARGFALDLTGTFDDRTQTALMDFQRARSLAPTGGLDTATVAALGVDPRDVMPVRGPARAAP